MNYYNEIKNKLIDNEIYSKVKDYSKERHKVTTYFEIGKLLTEAGGTMPEDLPRPDRSLKELEKENKKLSGSHKV